MPDAIEIEPFQTAPNDPLASQHAAIGEWIAEATEVHGTHRYWINVDPKTLESGRAILAVKPDEARLLVLAAVTEVLHWDLQNARLKASAKSDMERANPYHLPGWRAVAHPRSLAIGVMSALMRRTLPFERDDLVLFIKWMLQLGYSYTLPASPLVRALQRYAAVNEIDPELRDLIRRFGTLLTSSNAPKEVQRLGTTLAQLSADTVTETTPLPQRKNLRPTPTPAPAGSPLILQKLKISLGMLPQGAALTQSGAEVRVGPDHFAMLEASPVSHEHHLLSEVLTEALNSRSYHHDISGSQQGKKILELAAKLQSLVLVAASERHQASIVAPSTGNSDPATWRSQYALGRIVKSLASSPAQFDRDPLFDFILYLCVSPGSGRIADAFDTQLFAAIDLFTDSGATLTEGERFVLHLWRDTRITGPALGISPPDIATLTRWIGDGFTYFLVPGERWSDALNADLASQPEPKRVAWIALLKHALTATTARPSARWSKTAAQHIAALGDSKVWHFFERWFPLVSQGHSDNFTGDTRNFSNSIHDENADALRGFLWLVPLLKRRDNQARIVAAVALTAYKKIPGVGPRAVKVGNAAIYTLSQIVSPEAIGQLAMLKVRVRFGTAQKEVEKAFDAAAAQLALPRDQIEEMSVPACGLEKVGEREESLGDYRAHLLVTGSDAEIRWFSPQGKQLKSIPTSVKKEHAETLKDLQGDTKDLQAMLSAQRDRIDGLLLEQKSWPTAIWRERYVDHPLVGTIARRLIWCVDKTPITIVDGIALDLYGAAVTIPGTAVITLWHPIDRSIDEVVAWRRRIEFLGVVQPFKQAHREVYLLTDAERRTNVYSNRFAAHILRQHQFSALCAARRWMNKLRLLVDAEYPPACRELPLWNLRAEFWIEGIGTDYGVDTNDSGTYLRLASDQIRFYRTGAIANSAHAGGGGYASRAGGPGPDNINEPIPLDQIPALVFSEIMRDVDLFVGVASIGNDPAWQDGGPQGRYIEYWRDYSFGDLSTSALSRRETLQALLPRLKIAERCTLAERFLHVRGTRRDYKIHLGSGNILMEPNDQYLCIVPGSSGNFGASEVHLPFEGDRTLSIILSKAFLLADDTTIKDSLINTQINRR